MRTIRILVAEMEPPLLRDITDSILRKDPRIEIVGYVEYARHLVEEASRTRPDLVLTSAANGEFPDEYRDVLTDFPRLRVIAIASEGRRGFLYVLRPQKIPLGALSAERLLAAIRDAAEGKLA